jgi:hypothetical protein
LTLAIENIEFSNTYANIIEGSKETATKYLKEELNDLGEKIRQSGEHFHCLNLNEHSPLPLITCLACLKSNYGIAGEGDYSTLTLSWFTQELNKSPIDDLFDEADWDKLAKIHSYDDL